jgi:hypothetical protein
MAFIAHNESGDQLQDRYAPAPVEHAGTQENPNLAVIPSPHLADTYPDNWFHPAYAVTGQQLGFTPHRYPPKTGHEITAVLHHGISRMMRAAPQDDDWRVGAPAEQAW